MVIYFWIYCFILSLERQKRSLNKNFIVSRETKMKLPQKRQK